MRFKASLGLGSKIISSLFLIFTVVMLIISYNLFQTEAFPLFVMGGFFSVILFFTFLYAPLSYEINNDHIAIVRRIGNFNIPRNEIVSVQALSKQDMGLAWRTMGNGGLFGYTGWYTSQKQGRMRWFVTQRNNYVMVVLANQKKYILTPDDVDGFLQFTQW